MDADLKRAELAEESHAAQQAAQQAAREQAAETVVRQSAMAITQNGSFLILRALPSRSSRAIGRVYDSENVIIVGQTQKCEIISNHRGCWVKAQTSAGTGYLFDAYLQRY